MPVLGITGGIATGKTLFSSCLRTLRPGLDIFDSDRRARELTSGDPEILRAIRDQFGSGVFDDRGVLRRPALRSIVFADPDKRKALEQILHPAIRRSWLELARAHRERNPGAWFAVDIPLLFETAAESQFDKIVVIACSPAIQRRRLLDFRHLDPALADSMIASQLPLARKIDRADFLIWNDGLPEVLETQVHLFSTHLLS